MNEPDLCQSIRIYKALSHPLTQGLFLVSLRVLHRLRTEVYGHGAASSCPSPGQEKEQTPDSGEGDLFH